MNREDEILQKIELINLKLDALSGMVKPKASGSTVNDYRQARKQKHMKKLLK